MDLCEPLNQAHRDQRKAERALRSGNIREAIKNFSTAAANFDQAESDFVGNRRQPLTLDADSYAVEALIAQRRFCLRQVELLTAKLEQVQRHWQALMEQQKKQSASSLSNLDYDRAVSEAAILGYVSGGARFDTNDLKNRLWEKINEQDSLLERLESDGTEKPKGAGDFMEASKCPKSDRTVIEELRQCNEALRHFIVILLSELESKTKEIDLLKKELSHSHSPSHRQRASTSPAKAMGKERKRATSEAAGALPDLPPLEFPALRPLNDRGTL